MINSLTSLRGIFILFIFLHHCMNIYPGGGSLAVAFFFVLGGFGMTLGYKERVLKPEFSYKQYLTRRCIKFYPLHWFCLLFALPLALLPLSLYKGIILFSNISLIHSWIPIKDFYFSFNMVSWYLADTMFFAIVFPVIFRAILKSTKTWKIVVVITFLLYTILVLMMPSEMYHAILYISPFIRITDFLFGIFLAFFYLSLKDNRQVRLFMEKYGAWGIWAIIGIIVLLVIESSLIPKSIRMIAPIYWPLIAALILIAALTEIGGGKFLENKWLVRLGKISFTIFLTHQLIIRYTTKLYEYLHIEPNSIYVFTTLVLTMVVSGFLDYYILNKVTQWLTKRIQPSMTAR